MKRLCAFLATCSVLMLPLAWGPFGARLAEAQSLSVKLSLTSPAGGPSVSITHALFTKDGARVGEFGGTLLVVEATASTTVSLTDVPNGVELQFAVPCHICLPDPGTLTTYVVPPPSLAFNTKYFLPFTAPPEKVGELSDAFFELSLVEVSDDKTAPTCQVTSDRTTILFTAQDVGSGINTITVSRARNARVVVDPFTSGTRDPVEVTATRIDPNRSMSVSIRVTDIAGNTVLCSRSVW